MKFLLALIVLVPQFAFAVDYDPGFNLRHRYNGTAKSLKDRDLTLAQKVQDPRIGLKHYGKFEPNRPSPPRLQEED